MIFYFDFATYFRLLRLAMREVPASRWRLLVRLLVRVPLVALFHAVCFFLDGILFPGLRKIEVRSPVASLCCCDISRVGDGSAL